MELWVTFVGTAASTPTAARNTSATLVVHGGTRVLVDCGEGTQRQLLRSGIGLIDLDAILVTHLHADHYLGLPGLLKTYGLRGRETPLILCGPPGTQQLFDALSIVIGHLPFAIDLRESESGPVLDVPNGAWHAFSTRHSIRSCGYALVEDSRPGAFNLDAARALGIPPGPLFGVLQRGQSIELDGQQISPDQVLGPARSGRRVVISGDTEPCDATREISQGADLLVHEATFLDDERARARETRHSTAAEAGAIASDANVAMLAITHISSRFFPRDLRREAQEVFPNTICPKDFDQIEIPFAERGTPTLHIGGARRIDGEVLPPTADSAATVVKQPGL